MVSVPWPAPLPSFRQGLNPIEAAPPPGLSALLGGVNDWRGKNRNLLVGIGADLLSGQWGSHTPQGSALDQQQQEKLKAEAKAAEQANATSAWIAQNYPQYANLPPAQAWELAMADQKAKTSLGSETDPATVREYQYFSNLTPEQQGAYLRMKRANPYLDVGTGFVQPDPLNPGQTSGPAIPIDNVTPSRDKALGGVEGKTLGENQALLASMQSKMPGLRVVTAKLSELGKKATYNAAGVAYDTIRRQTGQEPTEAAIARAEYISTVDNEILPLLRDTFGAQFTAVEGDRLRATLGNPDLSPAEKDAVLRAFIAAKENQINGLQAVVGGGQPTATYTFNPATGELE